MKKLVLLLALLQPVFGFAQTSGGQISRKTKQDNHTIRKRISTTSSNNGKIFPQRDDIFASNEVLPIKSSFSLSDIAFVKWTLLDAPYFSGHVLKRDVNRKQIRLKQVSCKQNDINDRQEWFNNNELNLNEDFFKFNSMRFTRIETGGFHVLIQNGTKLIVTDTDEKNLFIAYDFENYRFSPKRNPTYNSEQEVVDVVIVSNIMYVAHTGNGYAYVHGKQNGYISAINLLTDEIIWTSQPLTNNSWKISIVGNSIISGYGFTAEPDYLYVLDRFSGQQVQKIILKTGPEYIILKGQNVYVRTYSEDYVFAIQ